MEIGILYFAALFIILFLFFECTCTGEKILDKIIEKYYKK